MKRRYYLVAISKSYFAQGCQDRRCAYTDFYELPAKVLATSRASAAVKWWNANVSRLVGFMRFPQTTVTRISVYCNDPLTGVSGSLGRLEPVHVLTIDKQTLTKMILGKISA